MRTTVTLDEDVAERLSELMRDRRQTFKETINHVLRAGLFGSARSGRRFRQRTFKMGYMPEVLLDKALSLAADLEDEEIARKLSVRK